MFLMELNREINRKERNSEDFYYEKDYMKIKFTFRWWLTSKQTITISYYDYSYKIGFEENGKPYPQVFLDDTLYELNI